MITRKATEGDYNALQDLWVKVFGDAPEDVDQLYEMLDARGYVFIDTEQDDAVCSALTIYEAGNYNGRKVYVSYAICTDPAFRSNGYGRAITDYARDLVASKGAVSLLCPAEESLENFYSDSGYKPTMTCLQVTLNEEELASGIFNEDDFSEEDGPLFPSLEVKAHPISSDEYGKYREAFLKDVVHITLSDEMLDYISATSYDAQGMLLLNNGDAICVLDRGDENGLFLSELLINPELLALSSEIHEEFAAGLAKLFKSRSISYRTIGDSKVQAMTYGFDLANDTTGYYGFPID